MAIAAIVADDFSSATDCGVQFSSHGLETVALMALPCASERLAYDVASIDTDSRAATSDVAYEKVRQAAALVKASGYRYIYKSIDSTLRGNLGAEIDAMLDVFLPDFAFVAPAFPYWGRTTKDGYHYLNGVPISESQFSKDPVWPIQEPSLVRLLASQTKRRVGLIDISGVRGGMENLATRLEQLKTSGVEVVVFDAETEGDLKRIAQISAAIGKGSVIVGSTGLSQYLSDAWGISRGERPAGITDGPGPVILVAGSASPTTRRQVQRFLDSAGTFGVEIHSRSIITGHWLNEQTDRLAGVRDAIDRGCDVALYLTSTPGDVEATQKLGEARGMGKLEVSNLIVTTMAKFVVEIARQNRVHGFLLTGGDTAKAVCHELGATGMKLLSEVEPGIPAGRLVGPRDVLVVTKAGAFGSDDVLNQARRVLRGAL